MNTITVPKERLLAALVENRESHRDIFLKAQEHYRERMIAELDRALEEARAGGEIRRMFSLPVPEDHTADFDTAIGMVEWEVNDTVELEQHDFEQYVLNKWRWAASFAANTEAYLVST